MKLNLLLIYINDIWHILFLLIEQTCIQFFRKTALWWSPFIYLREKYPVVPANRPDRVWQRFTKLTLHVVISLEDMMDIGGRLGAFLFYFRAFYRLVWNIYLFESCGASFAIAYSIVWCIDITEKIIQLLNAPIYVVIFVWHWLMIVHILYLMLNIFKFVTTYPKYKNTFSKTRNGWCPLGVLKLTC